MSRLIEVMVCDHARKTVSKSYCTRGNTVKHSRKDKWQTEAARINFKTETYYKRLCSTMLLMLCCIVRRYSRATVLKSPICVNIAWTVAIVRTHSLLSSNACRNQRLPKVFTNQKPHCFFTYQRSHSSGSQIFGPIRLFFILFNNSNAGRKQKRKGSISLAEKLWTSTACEKLLFVFAFFEILQEI